MKLAFVALWASLIALVVAQNLGDLPKCAQTCVGSSLGGCNPLNITCICTNKSFISDLSCCIAGACDPHDQAATIKFADQICAVAKVSLPQTAGCSAAATGQNISSIVDITTSTGLSRGSSVTLTTTETASPSPTGTSTFTTMSRGKTSTGTTTLSTTSVSTSMSSNGATSTAEKTNGLSNTPTSTAASTSQSSAAAGHAGLDSAIGMVGLAAAAFVLL